MEIIKIWAGHLDWKGYGPTKSNVEGSNPSPPTLLFSHYKVIRVYYKNITSYLCHIIVTFLQRVFVTYNI